MVSIAPIYRTRWEHRALDNLSLSLTVGQGRVYSLAAKTKGSLGIHVTMTNSRPVVLPQVHGRVNGGGGA